MRAASWWLSAIISKLLCFICRVQELRELGELSPHWDNLRKEVITRYGGIISSYQETLTELDKITGMNMWWFMFPLFFHVAICPWTFRNIPSIGISIAPMIQKPSYGLERGLPVLQSLISLLTVFLDYYWSVLPQDLTFSLEVTSHFIYLHRGTFTPMATIWSLFSVKRFTRETLNIFVYILYLFLLLRPVALSPGFDFLSCDLGNIRRNTFKL